MITVLITVFDRVEKIIAKTVTLVALLTGTALILVLAGCSGAATAQKDDGLIRVVASTNVYGDIAKTIGGDRVAVTSIISDPSQDPHSYEANAQVQLALSRADVVIQNGGGYDAFVGTLLKGANNPKVVVLDAVTISGYDPRPGTGSFNEHMWYDVPTVRRVADRVTKQFSALDSGGASAFAANAARFTAALDVLQASEATIKTAADGEGAAITESVPLYLLDAVGLVNKTPEKFSAAIEAGTDVSPVALQQTLALFSGRAVKLLAYNEQTTSPETVRVRAAARKAGIAVVLVRETLPRGKTYVAWMTDTLVSISGALR